MVKVRKSPNSIAAALDRSVAFLTGLASGIAWVISGFVDVSSGLAVGLPMIVQTLGPGVALITSSLVAWRWAAFGGFLLFYEGVFIIFLIILAGLPPLHFIYSLCFLGLPVLIAGILFLLGWLETNASKIN